MSIEQRIINIAAEQLLLKNEEVKPESSIIDDLGADSLDWVELRLWIEDEFGIEITDADAEKVVTIQDAINLVGALTSHA